MPGIFSDAVAPAKNRIKLETECCLKYRDGLAFLIAIFDRFEPRSIWKGCSFELLQTRTQYVSFYRTDRYMRILCDPTQPPSPNDITMSSGSRLKNGTYFIGPPNLSWRLGKDMYYYNLRPCSRSLGDRLETFQTSFSSRFTLLRQYEFMNHQKRTSQIKPQTDFCNGGLYVRWAYLPPPDDVSS